MINKITADGRIHYSHYASQPTVLIACGLEADTWEVLYPKYKSLYGNPLAHGYTFERKKVTCRQCKKWIKNNPVKKIKIPWKRHIEVLLCWHKWESISDYVKKCSKCRRFKLDNRFRSKVY
jgi:hypothetical protein